MNTKLSSVAIWETISLLSITVSGALLPGLLILWTFNRIYPDHPDSMDIVYLFSYIVKSVATFFFGFCALMIYANVAFPVVMIVFERILTRAGESIVNLTSNTITDREDINANTKITNANIISTSN